MGSPVASFWSALVYFTRIPGPGRYRYGAEAVRSGSAFAPFVGWSVGAVSAGALVAAGSLFPASVAVLLSMAVAVLITGAIHEDGFADYCDAFGAGGGPERVLAIMRDPRVGTFGLVGTCLLLGLKYAALVEIVGASARAFGSSSWGIVAGVLVAAHALSRSAAVAFMATHDHVRTDPDSRAAAMSSRFGAREIAIAAIGGIVPIAALAITVSVSLLWTALAVAVVAVALGRQFTRKLGGYTGDCLGAVQQCAEAACLLTACAILGGATVF